jgi:proteasome lid subunit RPN8/RPN11
MITVEQAAEKVMNEDAVNAFPDECCGFMFGHEDDAGNRTVIQALPINNAATENRRRRFVISPKDYMKGEQYAIEHDVQLLGIYHSHPNHPAIPSEHDRVAAQPFFSYVIISVQNGIVDHTRSWLLNENFQFDEERYTNQLTNTIK